MGTMWTKKIDPLVVGELKKAEEAVLGLFAKAKTEAEASLKGVLSKIEAAEVRLKELEDFADQFEKDTLTRLEAVEKSMASGLMYNEDHPVKPDEQIVQGYTPWSKRKAARIAGSSDIAAMKQRILKVSPPPEPANEGQEK